MKVIKTELEKVLLVEPDVFCDDRGFFLESYSQRKYEELGIKCLFVQDNHSRSLKKVIRGLHFQTDPGQAKLVRCTRGRIFDIVVDIRIESSTFGHWISVELSEENKKQIFIPIGFAHGFATLDDVNDVQYKCSSHYNSETEAGICWNDSDIGIEWPIKNSVISKRDENNMSLKEYKRNPLFKN